MSEDKKPPAFYCPACGQKHRAKLDSLVAKPGSVMHLSCAGCAIPLALRLDEQGAPVCTREDAPAEPAEAPSTKPEEKPAVKEKGAAPVPRKKRKKGEAPVPRSKRKRTERKAKKEKQPEKEKQSDEKPPRKTAGDEETEEGKPADPPTAGDDAPDGEGSPDAEGSPAGEAPDGPPDAGEADAGDEVHVPLPPGAEEIEAEFEPGSEIGRYTIEKAIGKGGCSTVYKAFDPTTNRSVALKVLAKDVADVIANRFLREIEVQANIRHQNIMPVFDRGELEDGRPFFTMELLYRPWTLAQIVQHRDEGKLARYTTLKKLDELDHLVREVILPVADGIYVANVENGVIHRDLKPDNVLVDSRTLRPYVIDFGICHVLERKSGFASKTVIPPTTEDEGIVGTPRYIAPEQVKGSAHARTDVWGLGATLHYIVAGEPPIASASNIGRAELKRRIAALQETKDAAIAKGDDRKVDMCEEMLVRLTDPNLRTVDDLFKDAKSGKYSDLPASTPAGLKAVIQKAMSVSTSDRYVNARQLGTELQAWLDGARVRALSAAGGKAAAVESARRAVRAHTVTAVWLLLGAALGLGLAYAFAKPGAAPPSSRVADAEEDISLLDGSLAGMDRVADSLTAVERNRLWTALDKRARQILMRLAKEPDVGQVHARRERLRFVRDRFRPPRYRFDFPAKTKIVARNLVTDEKRSLEPGENTLAPGAYLIEVGASVRFPLDVPFTVRTDKDASKAAIEPPLAVYRLPIELARIPTGMCLVLGGEILARDLPFNPPSTAATVVQPFLMDESEVTNSAYARFLTSLPAAERKERSPQAAFVPDAEEDGAPVVIKGRENAPVVAIRPEDAAAYAAWRGKASGATVRLPTEAEWVLAAGAGLGHSLPNGARGLHTDADLTSPLRDAGAHKKDMSPYLVRGLYGNAREMVMPFIEDLKPGAVLVKGAGVGDDPDQGAIYIHRVLGAGERHATTGFRCVQELPDAGDPPR